jgi:ankyrin repeat protein
MKKITLIVGLIAILCACAVMIGTPAPAPVAEAAMRGDREAVKTLLQKGADVNVPLSDGMTALHYAASLGDAQMAEMLIYAGANPQARTRINDYTPLHLAAESGSGAVVKMLLTAGADVNATTTVSGVTPIHLAASAGNVDAVNALLEKGANPNAREAKWDQTPLIFAAANNRAAVIAALLARGADPNIASKGVKFPPPPPRGFFPGAGAPPAAGAPAAAGAAAEPAAAANAAAPAAGGRGGRAGRGNAAPATDAATATPAVPPANAQAAGRGGRGGGQGGQAGSNVNDDAPVGRGSEGMGGMTPLHHAARQGNLEAVRSLIAGGANLNIASFDSTTPLAIAVLNSQFDVALALVKAGADVNKPLTYVNAAPLWLTINSQWQPRTRFPQPQEGGYQKASYLDVVKALLDAGADPNAKLTGHPFFMEYTDCGNGRCGLEDMTNNTPFMRAAYSLDVPAMKLLVERGANPSQGIVVAENANRFGAAATVKVPTGPVMAIHYVAGEGYGEGFAGNAHVHAPDAWMAAMRYIVEDLHQDVNARDALGYTALHHAASRGDTDMIMYLVSKGADISVVSSRGQTVADMANSPVSRVSPMPTVVSLLEALGSANSHKCTQC